VTAAYSGDANFTGSTSSVLAKTIAKASTSVALHSSAASPLTGQPVTLTASVSVSAPGAGAPTGSVTFSGHGGPLCSAVTLSSGVATCTTTYDAVGTDSVTATYSGDANFNGAASLGQSEHISLASTMTMLGASADPVDLGQTVTFSATVSPVAPSVTTPTGTVTFSLSGPGGAAPTCSGGDAQPLSGGVATCVLAAGTLASSDSPLVVSAAYGATAADGASTASPLVETVSGAVATTTTVTSSADPSVGGTAVTFTAQVSPTLGSGHPTGKVTFLVRSAIGQSVTCTGGDTVKVSASTGQAKCAVAQALLYGSVSPYTVVATFGGSAGFGASSSAPLQQSVTPAADTLTVTASANPVKVGKAVTFTATLAPSVTGGPGFAGSVTFSIPGGIVCTGGNRVVLSGHPKVTCSVPAGRIVSTGPLTVTATYTGDADYASATGQLTETVRS
jgi:hypothetical protein